MHYTYTFSWRFTLNSYMVHCTIMYCTCTFTSWANSRIYHKMYMYIVYFCTCVFSIITCMHMTHANYHIYIHVHVCKSVSVHGLYRSSCCKLLTSLSSFWAAWRHFWRSVSSWSYLDCRCSIELWAAFTAFCNNYTVHTCI